MYLDTLYVGVDVILCLLAGSKCDTSSARDDDGPGGMACCTFQSKSTVESAT